MDYLNQIYFSVKLLVNMKENLFYYYQINIHLKEINIYLKKKNYYIY